MENYEEFGPGKKQQKNVQRQKDNITDFFAQFGILCLLLATFVVASLSDDANTKDYKNIVIDINNKILLVEDVNTKEQRTLELVVDVDAFKYVRPGDIVNIRMERDKYKKSKYLRVNNSSFKFNTDSLRARKQREIFNAKKNEMTKAR